MIERWGAIGVAVALFFSSCAVAIYAMKIAIAVAIPVGRLCATMITPALASLPMVAAMLVFDHAVDLLGHQEVLRFDTAGGRGRPGGTRLRRGARDDRQVAAPGGHQAVAPGLAVRARRVCPTTTKLIAEQVAARTHLMSALGRWDRTALGCRQEHRAQRQQEI